MATTDPYKNLYAELNIADDATIAQRAAKIAEISNALKLAGVSSPSLTGFVTSFSMGSAQTGNADTTNTFDFGEVKDQDPVLIKIAATGTTTPTCTYAIKGSVDDSTYVSLEFSDSSDWDTFASDTFALTPTGTTTTVYKMVKGGQNYRYLKVVMSSNTNVTNTIDALPFGD